MNLSCLSCGRALHLLQDGMTNYSWQCPEKCLPPVDTGVPVCESIDEFKRELSSYAPHNLLIRTPLSAPTILGAKVYAPQILIHFIECRWGGCYNSIYTNFLVPHFDSVSVLDHVLRTSAVLGETALKDGIPRPKMFPELLRRLRGIRSTEVQRYLGKNFGTIGE